jgi:hypothetical protein
MSDATAKENTEAPQEETGLSKALTKIEPRELEAYKYFCSSKQPTIAPSTEEKMFGLFLQGKSCEDIRKVVPGFTLGSIVHARVHSEWDRRKDEHREKLLNSMQSRIQQTQMEAVDYICDLIAATHKLNRDKLHRYILNGDEADLEGIGMSAAYKSALEMFFKLTGQDNKKVVKGEITHNHTGAGLPPTIESSTPTQDEASDILSYLASTPKR